MTYKWQKRHQAFKKKSQSTPKLPTPFGTFLKACAGHELPSHPPVCRGQIFFLTLRISALQGSINYPCFIVDPLALDCGLSGYACTIVTSLSTLKPTGFAPFDNDAVGVSFTWIIFVTAWVYEYKQYLLFYVLLATKGSLYYGRVMALQAKSSSKISSASSSSKKYLTYLRSLRVSLFGGSLFLPLSFFLYVLTKVWLFFHFPFPNLEILGRQFLSSYMPFHIARLCH